ncbi:hypothetical protein [Paenibacillus chitinolyticus]|uniref:hypothetical protein n=1 Tax=Paenibacillus chitinolyticus TaxID=79263 RepID=UPI003635AF58
MLKKKWLVLPVLSLSMMTVFGFSSVVLASTSTQTQKSSVVSESEKASFNKIYIDKTQRLYPKTSYPTFNDTYETYHYYDGQYEGELNRDSVYTEDKYFFYVTYSGWAYNTDLQS